MKICLLRKGLIFYVVLLCLQHMGAGCFRRNSTTQSGNNDGNVQNSNNPNNTTGTASNNVGNTAGNPNAVPPAAVPYTAIPKSAEELPCNPEAAANIEISVNTQKGPGGGNTPLAINNNLYSLNIYDITTNDYSPTTNPNFLAFLKPLRPAQLRWPAGNNAEKYTVFGGSPGARFQLTRELVDSFIRLCREVGAEPFLAVNITTGNTDQATAFLRYVNIEKKYNVKWWQVGNEPDVGGYGNPYTPESYAQIYLEFAKAMRAIDPSIKLVGAELMTGANIMGSNGNRDWMTPILQIAGKEMDAVAWHYYPMDSGQKNPNSSAFFRLNGLLQESAEDWPPAGMGYPRIIMPYLLDLMKKYAPQAENWIDEYAEDPGPGAGYGMSDKMVGAIWAADSLMRFASWGTNRIFKFIYKGDPTHGYTLLDVNYNVRPEYYTYWLYAQHFGDRLVDAVSSDATTVAVHGSVLSSKDGSLRLMVANKKEQPQIVRIKIDNFTPTSAGTFTLATPSMTLDGFNAFINEKQTLTLENIGMGANALTPKAIPTCNEFTYTLPPASVSLLIFNNR
jgi:hypothetical protein